MSKPSSFTSYLTGLPKGKSVAVHLKGGQTLNGQILENVTTNEDETITIDGRFIDGSINGIHLIRLCDVSAITFQ